ncbi:restriction endonuclease subunit S [Pseudovibrio sp. Tun.PSC04-5.I4]|uniref:restriction endonuclease subunit S n=1 Tax=Pseudovibrio sp. Tun.PSC04-5.I4 TaxID=1798213 RepID=UPI0008923253|nr:restriction endonuclease subunit S [Pseudovibrio sp. Tun.PSC04-5.I4]SDR02419.1 type I restriction enzyme, S subunit [Pseudovibrio sp. Tun.PSC04-5.I4]
MVPEGWVKKSLEDVAEIRTGVAKGKKSLKDPVSLPYLRVANVQDGYLDLSEMKTIEVNGKDIERYSLKDGDVVLTEGGDFDKLGRGTIWRDEVPGCLHQNHVFAVRVDRAQLLPEFFAMQSGGFYGKKYFLSCAKRSTNLASINSTQLKQFPAIIPPLPEQKKIAEILGTWDRAIETASMQLKNASAQKRALMQHLLTGTHRLKGFEGSEWKTVRIGDIASEYSKRNKDDAELTVISCTKTIGFVNSLDYFKKKVFSDDLTGYKIIKRGQIGYPSNHIEEGSIGLQNLYNEAIVSPIYTVFETGDTVSPLYLFRLLKTDRYRQIFAAATNASVDRRGSLRWSAFSSISVSLPSLEEQRAINDVLCCTESEVKKANEHLSHLRTEKRALMQQLLTGKTRVKVEAEA